MRILHLTTELPYAPGGSGGSTRQFYLLRRLVELGHEVIVVAPMTAAHERETGAVPIMAAAGLDYRPVRRMASRELEVLRATAYDPRLLGALARRPLTAWQFGVFWVGARGRVRAAVRDLKPDVVLIEHDHLAGWAADLADLDVPKVLVAHNVTCGLYATRAAAARGARRRMLRLESRRHRAHARRHMPLYDSVIAVSEADARALTQLGARRVEVVPNGAPVDEVSPFPDSADPPTLLFTGSMNHPPNLDAALWLGQEIFPLVAQGLPDARLLIVGRGPQEELGSLRTDPRIEVTGAVPDIAPYFRRATVAIAPLRSGGGTRLKILEALNAGRAVVATHLGAEGLALEDGEHLLLADDPPGLARAAAALLGDPVRRQRLAAAGRAVVERRYDWRVLGDELEGALLRATGAVPASEE
jgi:glycosyltransferase involved in cell wall biosynthesis